MNLIEIPSAKWRYESSNLDPNRIRLEWIRIQNYKGIKDLTVNFPIPPLESDPDTFMLASGNGGGKTAVLECCALLMLADQSAEINLELIEERSLRYEQLERLNRYLATLFHFGAKEINITGAVKIHDRIVERSVTLINSDSGPRLIFNRSKSLKKKISSDRFLYPSHHPSLPSIFGLAQPSGGRTDFLHFNSYRRVVEDNPNLGDLVKSRPDRDDPRVSDNYFKRALLQLQMGVSGVFGEASPVTKESYGKQLEIVNQLLRVVAEVNLAPPKPGDDNQIAFQVKPVNTSDSDLSFSFDRLSSGQKEIVSTLFYIYINTINSPKIVLIDEPELHLNAEWHRPFMNWLTKNLPLNQYIFATHSLFFCEYVLDQQIIILK